MITPPKLATPDSASLVTAEVQKLLRAAGAMGRIPTPRADILETLKLVQIGHLDLAEFELSRTQKAADTFHRAFQKLYGFFDRRTQVIYVNPDIHASKQTFTTYHEVTHRILPWQNFGYTEDDKDTLVPSCEELFESEANFGAADIMFQCNSFEAEARDFELCVTSALHLANRYEASCHSSLRRFVERNHRPCSLLVLKKTTRVNQFGGVSFRISHAIPSPSFTVQFGEPFPAPFINPDDELGKIVNSGADGEIALLDSKGFRHPFKVELFTNQYSQFLMFYPQNAAPARKRVVRIVPTGQTFTMVEQRGFLR